MFNKAFMRGVYKVSSQVWMWVAFNVFVLAMLAVDLGVVHRRAH